MGGTVGISARLVKRINPDTMLQTSGHLFDHHAAAVPAASVPEELTTVLAAGQGVRVERIVSTGQSSPPDFWYDQDRHEWVAVLAGSAVLRFEDETEGRRLMPGDWVLIPAHRRHRVEATAADRPTVWLAVFFR